MSMSEYCDMFKAEANEHLQQLNHTLLELEQDNSNLENIKIMFRAAHTLKGMAATMGYNKIAEVTHEMENLMDSIRNQEIDINSTIINVLFECLDQLEYGIENIETECNMDISAILFRLNEVSSNAEKHDHVAENITCVPESIDLKEDDIKKCQSLCEDKDSSIFNVQVTLDETCLLKTARTGLVLRELDKMGTVVKTVPSQEDIDSGKIDNEINLVFVTANNENVVIEKISKVSEISNVKIDPLDLDNILAAEKTESMPSIPSTPTSTSKSMKNSMNEDNVKSVQSVRVSIERLDNLMNMVGELLINKSRLNQLAIELETKKLDETLASLDRLTNDIQVEVMDARMVQIDQVFNRFPRMVRDLSIEQKKKISFLTEGNEIELDRTVLDEIGDPLVHLLRNAVDHGIETPEERIAKNKTETGSLNLKASRLRNNVLIELQDDGRGIDPVKMRDVAIKKGLFERAQANDLSDREAMYLIFEPGFSAAEEVTDISGRGVGMDAVKNKIEDLGGSVELESVIEKGTTIRLKLPLTVAIIQSLLVNVGEETYAVPINNIVRDEVIEQDDIRSIKGEKVVNLRGEVLPLVDLHDVLSVPQNKENYRDNNNLLVVVVEKAGQHIGLIVDKLLGQQEVIIKTLDNKLLKNVKGFSGATILGNGNVALILDVPTLV